MTAENVLLSVAFAFLAGGLCHLVISIKRIGSQWVSEFLDGCGAETR